jgi:hypothetical protein
MSTPHLLPFAGLAATSARFRGLVDTMAADLGTDPNWILAVMRRESGYDPRARNAGTNATGLIQFMPATAKIFKTTVDELASLTREDQAHFVWRFYRPHRGKLVRPVDVYLATFAPAFIGGADDQILFAAPSGGCTAKPRSAYCANLPLDADKSGAIEVRDLARLMAQEIIDAAGRIDSVGFLAADEVPLSDLARRPASSSSSASAIAGGILIGLGVAGLVLAPSTWRRPPW